MANVTSHAATSLQRELERLASDYMRGAKVSRRPTCVQLPRMWDAWAFLSRKAVADPGLLHHPEAERLARGHVADDGFTGTFVHTTWPQLAEGVGFPVIGMGAKRIADRYESRLKCTVRYLMAAGRVAGWDVIYEGREPIGILVRVSRRSSSVGSSSSIVRPRTRPRGDCPAPISGASRGRVGGRGAPAPDRFSFGPKVGGPGGNLKEGGDSSLSCSLDLSSVTAVGVRERALSVAQRAHLAHRVWVALEIQRSLFGDREAADGALERLPWLAGVPVDIVAREAARVFMPGLDLRLSRLWQERLEVAAGQIARHGWLGETGPGAAVQMVLWIVAGGDWTDLLRNGEQARPPRPRSLGAVAVCLRRAARRAMRGPRAARRRSREAQAHV